MEFGVRLRPLVDQPAAHLDGKIIDQVVLHEADQDPKTVFLCHVKQQKACEDRINEIMAQK